MMARRFGSLRGAARLAASAILAATIAHPAEAGGRIDVELNRLAPRDGGCQTYLVISNGRGARFETLNLDFVFFDQDGVVARRLAVETGPLRAERTSVKSFMIEGLACEAVGRVLLNDVLACRDAEGAREDCFDLVETSARGGVELVE